MQAAILDVAIRLDREGDRTGNGERHKVARMLRDAADAVVSTCYTPHDLKKPATLKAAMQVLQRDLADTRQNLEATGLAGAVPAMLSHTLSRSVVRDERPIRNVVMGLRNFLFDQMPTNPNVMLGQAALLTSVAITLKGIDSLGRRLGIQLIPRPGDGTVGLKATKAVMATARMQSASYKGPRGLGAWTRPSALVSMTGKTADRDNPFGMSVDDRLARLAAMSTRMNASARLQRVPTDAELLSINRTRRQARDIAMSLRIDSRDWTTTQKLCSAAPQVLSAVEDCARCGPLRHGDFPLREFKETTSGLYDRLAAPGVGVGVGVGNDWCQIQRHRVFLADPADPDGRCIDWTGRDLRKLPLAGANLARASLTGCNLAGMDLRGTCLSGADIQNCDFTNARLGGAVLRDARILESSFSGATGAKMDGAFFTPNPSPYTSASPGARGVIAGHEPQSARQVLQEADADGPSGPGPRR